MAFEKACSPEAPTTDVDRFHVLQNSIDPWDVQDFRPVNEFLDDNFDFRQACSKTFLLTPT